MAFERTLWARWGDMDFNGHMRNTAYLDAAGDVRMMFFAEHGYTMADFERARLGPVIRRDEVHYYRELKLLDRYRVTLEAAGSSPDGSHFCLRNEFWREDGHRAARITSHGGWLDLRTRRFRPPPDELLAVIRSMDQTEAFEELPTLVRS